MRPRVLIFGGPLWVQRARDSLQETAAVVDAGEGAALQPPPHCVLFADSVDESVVRAVAAVMPHDRRHCLLAVRGPEASVDVDWTVIVDDEVARALALVVQEAEAVAVELLARVRVIDDQGSLPRLPTGVPAPATTKPVSRFGCVVSVGSGGIVCAIDDVVRVIVVSFVLPGAGPIEVRGTARRVPGRPGLVQVDPDSEEVRQRLLQFTICRDPNEVE